jgi:hypothetical protein
MTVRSLSRSMPLGDRGQLQHFGGFDDPAGGQHRDEAREDSEDSVRGVRFHSLNSKRLASLQNG